MRSPTLLRRSTRPVSPLTMASWHTAFWASGPEFAALGLADGAAVATLPDEAGAHDATQATAGNRPTYRASVAALGGRPAIEFDGVSDFLQTAAFTALSQLNEIVIVGRFRSLDATTRPFCDGIASGNRHRVSATSTVWALFAGAAITGGTPDANGHFLRAVFSATDTLDIDGTNLISGNAGAVTLTGVTLGANYDGSGNAPVDIAFLGVSDTSLGGPVRDNLLAWARSYYGLPLA